MEPVYLSLWIVSYTLSLLTLLLGFLTYAKERENALKYFLLHKLNLFIVIVLFMASLIVDIDNVLFQVLLFNVLGVMNFNLSRMIFSFARKKLLIWPTLILPLISQGILNLLFLLKAENLLYFYIALMFAPIVVAGILRHS